MTETVPRVSFIVIPQNDLHTLRGRLVEASQAWADYDGEGDCDKQEQIYAGHVSRLMKALVMAIDLRCTRLSFWGHCVITAGQLQSGLSWGDPSFLRAWNAASLAKDPCVMPPSWAIAEVA